VRILFLGLEGGTTKQRANALRRLGHDVTHIEPEKFVPQGLARKIHYNAGGLLIQNHVKRTILSQIGDQAFELVWVDRGRYIGPGLIKEFKRRNAFVANHSGDDPFSYRDRLSWSLFKLAVRQYDYLLVVREENVAEAKRFGVKRVERVWRAADEVAHRPREFTEEQLAPWLGDVVFVGTNMDRRGEFMKQLLDLKVPLSITGDRWQVSPQWPFLKDVWRGVSTKTDDDYAAAILGAKVSLGLLSGGNRDLHTMRSVEIPYMGGLFCAERTSEHDQLYVDGKEAIFWSTPEECAEKSMLLINDPGLRQEIARNGQARALANGLTNENLFRAALAKFNLS
jgi:spore maturation protein CgeB